MLSTAVPTSNAADQTARFAPTCFQVLRQMHGSQRLAFNIDMCDVISDFLFAFSVQESKYNTLVLIFAFIGLVTVVSKLLVLRRAFLNEVDGWDQTLQLIYIGYINIILEDIPQMILLFVIVGDNRWTFFPKCSLGISIISVAWKLIQELLVMNRYTVTDETRQRQTPCEKFFCKTKEDSHHNPTHHIPTPHIPTPHIPTHHIPTHHIPTHHIPTPHIPTHHIPTPQMPTHHIPTHHNPTQNTQIPSVSDQTKINPGTTVYHGNVTNNNGTYHKNVMTNNGNIVSLGGTMSM